MPLPPDEGTIAKIVKTGGSIHRQDPLAIKRSLGDGMRKGPFDGADQVNYGMFGK